MIEYRVGDLIAAALDGEVFAIGHGCNCFNTMRAGIAPKIANAFPEAFLADQSTQRGDRGKLGGLSVAASRGILVFNLYTQYGFTGRSVGKKDLDYWALHSSLDAMSQRLKRIAKNDSRDIESLVVGLPKIGSGLAGGDWKIIHRIISDRLKDHPVVIYVLNPEEVYTSDDNQEVVHG